MITNERQHGISKKQLGKLEDELRRLRAREETLSGAELEWAQLESAALEGTIGQVRAEIIEYQALRSRGGSPIRLRSAQDLPDVLIRGRIARGLNQRELGELLGMTSQQVQRYESTRYASASLTKVIEVASALEIEFEDAPFEYPALSKAQLFSRLGANGVERPFVVERLLQRTVADALDEADEDEESLAVTQAAEQVERVLGVQPGALGDAGATMSEAASGLRFKIPQRTQPAGLLAYIAYARFVMEQAAAAASSLGRSPVPDEAASVRAGILQGQEGEMTFEAALRYVWGTGIVVVPLADPGKFHGAWLRTGGRDVIALKQRTSSSSRWMFDLLHELWHAHVGQDGDSGELVELRSLTPRPGGSEDEDEEESAANLFATNILLDGRPDELFDMCRERAGSEISYLKNAVVEVASTEGVPVGALANHVAYRLNDDGENWWGAAQNLQEDDDPRGIARRILLDRIDLGLLDRHGSDVVTLALADPA